MTSFKPVHKHGYFHQPVQCRKKMRQSETRRMNEDTMEDEAKCPSCDERLPLAHNLELHAADDKCGLKLFGNWWGDPY